MKGSRGKISVLWWIHEPTLLGSHNPSEYELNELSRQGLATVVSLLSEDERSPKYSVPCLTSLGIKRYSVPVRDYGAPTVKQFDEVLEIVRVRSRQGGILIHCQGGCGRTGTLAAAYWISKGLSLEDAIQ